MKSANNYIIIKILIFIVIIFFNVGYGYSQDIVISDTSVVWGVTKDKIQLENIVSKFSPKDSLFVNKIVPAGTELFVSGVRKTSSSNIYREENSYEVIYKNTPYYVKSSDLHFQNDKDYFSSIWNLSDSQYERFNNHAKQFAALYHEHEISNINKYLDRCKSYGLATINYSLHRESEYIQGTGFNVDLFNPTNKTIKYVHIYLIGQNAVRDPIIINNKSIVKVTGIGPIKPYNSGSYSFDYVWKSDLVQHVKITSIIVQYMNGETITIKNPQKILMPYREYLYAYGDD